MVIFCPKCGYENDEGTETCVSCGASLSAPTTDSSVASDKAKKFLEGLIYLRNYTIIGFLSIIVGLAMNFVFLNTVSYSYLVGPLGAAFGGSSINSSNVSSLAAYSEIALTVSAVLTLFGFFMLYRGFDVLKTADRQFSIGKTGTILEMVGMILVVLGAVGLLSVVLPIAGQGTLTPGSISSSQIGTLLLLAVMVLVAAIILLVGLIMALIGIYRVGGVFNNSVVKVGAILTVFLGIVGTILLFVGFNGIIKELREKSSKYETLE